MPEQNVRKIYSGRICFAAEIPVAESPMRHVFCDGVEVQSCFFADTDTGIAICYLPDENNRLIRDEKGHFTTRIYQGTVTIEVDSK